MNKVTMLRAQSNCKVMGHDLLSDSLGATLKSPDMESSVSREAGATAYNMASY